MAYRPKPGEMSLDLDTRGVTKSLREIGVPVDAIKAANKKSAKAVFDEARKIAPVSRYKPNKPGGAKYKTGGALRNTIRIADLSTSVKIRAGMKKVPYANPVHWGWFVDKTTGVRRNILPNPWMARALGYTRAEILDNYIRNMNNLIAKQKSSGPELPL
jgi:hypothetical protein